MRNLILTVSALALTAGMAQAQTVPTGEGPVFNAWMSQAEFHDNLPPFDPNAPMVWEPNAPNKPDPLEVNIRKYKQSVDGQASYVDQVGEGNTVDVDQTLAAGGTVSDVVQIGNLNAASVIQLGEDSPHYAVITQNGDENEAAIRQYHDIENGEMADIQQGGDGTNGGGLTTANRNKASIDQGINNGPVASYGNMAKIRQEGVTTGVADDNNAAIIQRGDNMRALIEQDGLLNNASVFQSGFNGQANNSVFEDNEGRVTQIGRVNTAAIWTEGQRNLASIDQVGDFNIASAEQFGSDNTALISSLGNDNYSVTLQTGDFNMAENVQVGNFNDSSIWQDGLGNMGKVIQTGDFNYSALDQVGAGNMADVSQNGFDWSDIEQTGGGNIAVVMQ